MKRLVMVCMVLLLTVGVASATSVTNGGFDSDLSGLSGWDTSGAVTGDLASKTAKLTDTGAGTSLSQEVSVVSGYSYKLEFEYKFEFSGFESSASFPDSFYATLYHGAPSPSSYDYIFSFDSNGIFDLNSSGMMTDSFVLGWNHFSMLFTASDDSVVPTFELFDLNVTPGDSSALIDNVSITMDTTPVPEPSTILLLGGGLLGAVLVRRRKRVTK